MRAVALLLVVVVAGCGFQVPGGEKKDDPGKAEPAAKELPWLEETRRNPIAAEDLFAAYQKDGGAAAAKYGTKTIRVSLRADKIDQMSGEIRVMQKFDPDSLYPHVDVFIPIAQAARVKAGKTVVVVAVVGRADHLSVMLTGRVE